MTARAAPDDRARGIPRGLGLAVVLVTTLAACRSDAEPRAIEAVRDTMPDGTARVHYPTLPDSATHVADVDLRIGRLEGDPEHVFGDVRGIQTGSDGRIYVLDYQASEIRTFDADGTYLETIASEGAGPGELEEANGMILEGDTLLWIQDHAKWQLLGLRTDGTETRRIPMHVLNHGYMWNGTVDDVGRFWKPTTHSDEPRRPPEDGLQTSSSRAYFVWLDLGSEERDSVYLGQETYRSYVRRYGDRGWGMQGIPHDPRPVTIVNPQGGLWRADGSEYRIVQLDDAGDTLLVIEAAVAPPPVTAEDREAVISNMTEIDESWLRHAEAIADAMPATKPAISGLVVDDEGRLWVRRGGTEAAEPRYDVFTSHGDFVMAVRLRFTPMPSLPLEIVDGRIYALVPDELDVPYVVRALIVGTGQTAP